MPWQRPHDRHLLARRRKVCRFNDIDNGALVIRDLPSIITQDLKSPQWCQLWVCGALPQCARCWAAGTETLGTIDEHLRGLTLIHELEISDSMRPNLETMSEEQSLNAELHEAERKTFAEATAHTLQCTSVENVERPREKAHDKSVPQTIC
ncbi:hypothetical protein BDW72DRAFT_188617 [Aspergillus terricola var. indicus]